MSNHLGIWFTQHRRKLAPLGILLLGLALISSYPAFSAGRGATNPGAPNAAAPEAVSPPVYPYGVQLFDLTKSANFPAHADIARSLGTRYVRLDVSWEPIQPNPPPTPGCSNCNWSTLDIETNTLVSKGLAPVLMLGGAPGWAATYSDGVIDKPGGLVAFANFVQAMVNRYPSVHHYAFYSEPDDWPQNTFNCNQGPRSCRGWGGHGTEYAVMLNLVYPIVHSAGGIVIFGGIAYENLGDCQGCPPGQGSVDSQFVGEVLAAAGQFDWMNYHFYQAFAPLYNPPNILGKAIKLKTNFPGLAGKQWALTEMGTPWNSTCPPVSHDYASSTIVKEYAELLSGQDATINIPVQAGMWFIMEDLNQACNQFGLLDPSGTPYPEEQATFQTLTNELGQANYQSIVNTGNSLIEGYNFVGPYARITVAWTKDGSKQFYSLQAASIRFKDKTGAIVQTIVDGTPGDPDSRPGWITLTLTDSPTYIEVTGPAYLPSLCNGCATQLVSMSSLASLLRQ